MIQLEPCRHEPPPGWAPQTFEAVTDALAAALVAAVRRSTVGAPPVPGAETAR